MHFNYHGHPSHLSVVVDSLPATPDFALTHQHTPVCTSHPSYAVSLAVPHKADSVTFSLTCNAPLSHYCTVFNLIVLADLVPSRCPPRQYALPNSPCQPCSPTCATCADAHSCTSCAHPAMLLPSCRCPLGYHLHQDQCL